MESDEKPPQAEQSEARISEQPATEGNGIGHVVQEELPQVPSARKDKGRLHATNHGVLSRYLHEALVRHGENLKTLRKIKRDLLAELKPSGTPGAMFFLFFDRFWSSYLRCLLAAKAEAATSAPIDQPAGESQLIASLKEREVPTLVFPDSSGTSEIHPSADLLRQLALVARYDAHFSREMYRALGILLILRGGGEAALERCYGKILGVNKEA